MKQLIANKKYHPPKNNKQKLFKFGDMALFFHFLYYSYIILYTLYSFLSKNLKISVCESDTILSYAQDRKDKIHILNLFLSFHYKNIWE